MIPFDQLAQAIWIVHHQKMPHKVWYLKNNQMMAFCKLIKNQKKFLPPVPAAIRNRPMYAKALK